MIPWRVFKKSLSNCIDPYQSGFMPAIWRRADKRVAFSSVVFRSTHSSLFQVTAVENIGAAPTAFAWQKGQASETWAKNSSQAMGNSSTIALKATCSTRSCLESTGCRECFRGFIHDELQAHLLAPVASNDLDKAGLARFSTPSPNEQWKNPGCLFWYLI